MKALGPDGLPVDAATVAALEDSPEARLLKAIHPTKTFRAPYTAHRNPPPMKQRLAGQYPEFLTTQAAAKAAGRWV